MESLNNDLVFGASGRIGEMLVFRQRGNKTFISKRPRRKETFDTPKQSAVKERFKEAVVYAKSVLLDPDLKAEYEARTSGNQTAYNMALCDYFKAPEIKTVNYAGYTGKAGDTISIRATDDFKVASVQLSILDSTGAELESGAAQLSASGLDWIYTAKKANANLAGCKLSLKAFDLPGNVGSLEIEL